MSRLTAWLGGAVDPVRLARQLKFTPDPWQAEVLRSTAPRMHLNCSRQVGKSTVTSILALHAALYKPAATVLIVSPSERQSNELFLKVTAAYRTLGRPIPTEAENMHMLRLENGSRIISLPASESGIRGFTVDLLLVDEAAYVPDELYNAVSPMLAVSGGRLVAMSTPAGRRGWWYNATLSDRWQHVKITAEQCPRISAQFLAEERDRLGEAVFKAEYMCSFVDAAGAAFNDSDITAAFAPAPTVGPPEALSSPSAPSDAEAGFTAPHTRIFGPRARALETAHRRTQRACAHRWKTVAQTTYCVFCSTERVI